MRLLLKQHRTNEHSADGARKVNESQALANQQLNRPACL